MKATRTISIRLLRDGKKPSDAIRDDVALAPADKPDGALIALDTIDSGTPKWASFLELTTKQKESIRNSTAYGLVFINASNRYFVVSFGLGHVKIKTDVIEQDFGLRVVLNTVAPDKLRSADIRTPDENSTTRRTQTARRSDQTAFSIDIERDIVRGLAGEPENIQFALRVAGSDGLTITKEMEAADLPGICSAALVEFAKTAYKKNFAWIDQIKHVRDKDTVDKLELLLAGALNSSLTGHMPDALHLAYPVIYDPEKPRYVQFKGFRSTNIHTDLEILSYISDLKEKCITAYEVQYLSSHKACECDSAGKIEGQNWKIKECLVFETDLDGNKYVLSGDRWYCIDINLSVEVTKFFADIPQTIMPAAEADDNEETYNKRIAISGHKMLCLDRRLLAPTGANYPIETCDFLSNSGSFIHVKDHTSSSRLSHLFNQGTVSARVLKTDNAFRDLLRAEIKNQEALFGLSSYQDLIADAGSTFQTANHKIVYAVLCSSTTTRLPFFSLVTFRQAAKELQALGFSCEFSWIKKPKSTKIKKINSKKKL